jgi:hypothetical protein
VAEMHKVVEFETPKAKSPLAMALNPFDSPKKNKK